jgi:YhcH/YjgK/YiaL family protein
MVFDTLKNAAQYYCLHEKFEAAFDFIKEAQKKDLAIGKYEIEGKELYASIQEYTPKVPENGKFEAHRNYIDIQYIISGIETMGEMDIAKASSKSDYNPEKDVEFYHDSDKAGYCVVEDGEFCIFFPHDVHKPGLMFQNVASPVKKIVVKVRV